MTAAGLPGERAIRIDGLRRTVADLRRSIDFYCGALGFAPSAVGATWPLDATRLRLGEQHIDLLVADDRRHVPLPASAPDPRFQHAAVVTADIEASWRRLEAHAAVAISRDGPQRLPANTGGVTAFKFRDPDGHPLELIEFPAGTGDPRWHAGRAGGPTLGIDHFALVVESIENSTSFFAGHGLQVAGRGINRGVEQDRLDGLEGVVVDVVALAPENGPRTPHLELLRYRRPTFRRKTDSARVEREPRGQDEIVVIDERDGLANSARLRLNDPDGHCFIL